MHRRNFIKAAGSVAGGLAIAGCSGQSGSGSNESGAEGHSNGTDESAMGNESAGNDSAGNESAAGTDGDDLDLDGEIGDSPDGLEVTNHELYQTNGEVGLRGTVENTGEQAYESVEAEVTLQDDQGEVLYEFIDETEEAQTTSLPAGESWDFDVVFEEAKMAEVTNYTINLDGDVAQTVGDEGNLSGGNSSGNATAGNETTN